MHSDLDVLVDAESASLFDLVHIEEEISKLTGFHTHVTTIGGIRHEKIMAKIMAQAKPI